MRQLGVSLVVGDDDRDVIGAGAVLNDPTDERVGHGHRLLEELGSCDRVPRRLRLKGLLSCLCSLVLALGPLGFLERPQAAIKHDHHAEFVVQQLLHVANEDRVMADGRRLLLDDVFRIGHDRLVDPAHGVDTDRGAFRKLAQLARAPGELDHVLREALDAHRARCALRNPLTSLSDRVPKSSGVVKM
jgi:hypothetical protein